MTQVNYLIIKFNNTSFNTCNVWNDWGNFDKMKQEHKTKIKRKWLKKRQIFKRTWVILGESGIWNVFHLGYIGH